jgi:hypothetical protein
MTMTILDFTGRTSGVGFPKRRVPLCYMRTSVQAPHETAVAAIEMAGGVVAILATVVLAAMYTMVA